MLYAHIVIVKSGARCSDIFRGFTVLREPCKVIDIK